MGGARVDPLDQFERDPFWTFEEPEPAADVVQLLAQHRDAIGLEMGGGGGDVVDPKGEVVVAPPAKVRGMLTGIGARNRYERQQLDLEAGVHPSSTSVMCSAFMSGMPMYFAGASPSMTATWPFLNPRSSKNAVARSGSATATVT